MSAGGAVDDPFPSTCSFTLGYEREKVSPQSVIRLFMVSEPMLDKLPETPLVFWYEAMAGSTLTAPAAGAPAVAAGACAAVPSAGVVDAGGGGAWLPPPHAASRATANDAIDTRTRSSVMRPPVGEFIPLTLGRAWERSVSAVLTGCKTSPGPVPARDRGRLLDLGQLFLDHGG